MKEFGLQLYSIRDHFKTAEDTRESFKKMKEYGYTQAQTAGAYDYMPAEDFKALADEYGIDLVGTHYSFAEICDNVEGTVKYHKTIGARYIGIGGMPIEARDDKEELLKFIAKYNEMAKIYKEYGFVLTYHNHSFEFKKIDGKTVFDYLIEGFGENVQFVVDVAWAHLGGMDVRALLERLDGRIAMLHLKDVQACYPYIVNGKESRNLPQRIEVGEGNMNFPGIIKTAEACGCQYFIVEDEVYSTGESYDSVRISATNIINKFLEK